MKRRVSILGSGVYLPERVVSSEEIDEKTGMPKGWTAERSGIETRRFVNDETMSYMAAEAVRSALKDANLELDDIDCVVSTSTTTEQLIPCNAVLIKEALKSRNNVPAFDVNATCLGFVVGMDLMSCMIEAGKYDKVVLVSSEISSLAIDWEHKESRSILGDGAAAVIIGKASPGSSSHIISSQMETHMEGAHFTEIKGMGSKLFPIKKLDADLNRVKRSYEEIIRDLVFYMDGWSVFKLANKIVSPFIDTLFEDTEYGVDDVKLFIPHQASLTVKFMMQKLGIDEDRYMYILPNRGNVVSASIPMALHEARAQNRIKRGDLVTIFGTGAGLSLGGILLEY